MSRISEKSDLDKMVDEYLFDLNRALSTIESSLRAQLVEEIGQHIAQLRSDEAVGTMSEMKNLLDRVGYPDDIAAAAMEDGERAPESNYRASAKVVLSVVAALITVALVLCLTLLSSGQKAPPAKNPEGTTASYTVPSLVGLNQASAVTALEAAGFRVGRVRNELSPEGPGIVRVQSPGAGTQAKRGSKVSLSISSGPVSTSVAVPNVVGESIPQAVTALQATGLTVAGVGGNPSGNVVSQEPLADSRVPTHSAITLTTA